MKTAEAIDKQLDRLHKLFVEAGEWTGEQYMEMVKPLHEALLKLAEKELSDDRIS
jgi:hypothetical protein